MSDIVLARKRQFYKFENCTGTSAEVVNSNTKEMTVSKTRLGRKDYREGVITQPLW